MTTNMIPHPPDKENRKSKTQGDTPGKPKPPAHPPDKGGQGGFISYDKQKPNYSSDRYEATSRTARVITMTAFCRISARAGMVGEEADGGVS